MIAVPRFYEKIRSRVLQAVADAPAPRRWLFHWAFEVAQRVREAREADERPGLVTLAKYGLADRLVLSKLRARLGLDRLRITASGGAALDVEVARFYHNAGLMLLEGYGLTEASPIITLNHPEAVRLGSVGQPLPGVEVRLDTDAWDGPEEEGELLARGPNVMQGYWNAPDETGATVEDGWLRTGDVATRDADGFYYIRDRKKELFKTAYGKYVAPQRVQGLITQSPWVEMAVIVGAERKYVAALLQPDFDHLRAWADEEGLDATDIVALVDHPDVQARMDAAVAQANQELPRHEQVKRHAVLSRPLEVGEELTPTLKIKRRVIEERYKDVLRGLYPDEG